MSAVSIATESAIGRLLVLCNTHCIQPWQDKSLQIGSHFQHGFKSDCFLLTLSLNFLFHLSQFPGSFAAWTVVDLGEVALLSLKTVHGSAGARKMEYRDVLRYVRNRKVSPNVESAKDLKKYPFRTQKEDVLVQNNPVFETKVSLSEKILP